MPRYIGGDLIEITCNHPTLGDFTFATKSNESYTLDPGGYRSNDDNNMIAGNGVYVDQINRIRWSFEGPLKADFTSNLELLNFPLLAQDPELAVWTFSHISGNVWRGTGKIVGDIQFDTNTAEASIKIAGGGRLEQL